MSTESLTFKGINGATESYLLPPEMTPEQISKIAQGEALEKERLKELIRLFRLIGRSGNNVINFVGR